ncbi:MAG: hypothetical protein BWY21_00047 [Parcubacteria group bacterium ADurb.Bin216]|nr:MAG: hypothetical protein BWY21_00047 [Parcubacteria group bacterium ADurb.Bin216]
MLSASILLLTACGPQYVDSSDDYILPEGLKDCKVYDIRGKSSIQYLKVIRCPVSNTSTSYRAGKVIMFSSVVEN